MCCISSIMGRFSPCVLLQFGNAKDTSNGNRGVKTGKGSHARLEYTLNSSGIQQLHQAILEVFWECRHTAQLLKNLLNFAPYPCDMFGFFAFLRISSNRGSNKPTQIATMHLFSPVHTRTFQHIAIQRVQPLPNILTSKIPLNTLTSRLPHPARKTWF